MKKMIVLLFSVLISISLFLSKTLVAATPQPTSIPSPQGAWQTIDDVTQTPRSVVRIQIDAQKQLVGKLIQIKYRPGEGPNDLCVRCRGALHNQKILGMTILTGLTQNPDHPLQWQGGHITDPESGKTYTCRLTLSPDGHSMKVRGYIGFPFLGRTQIWYRQ